MTQAITIQSPTKWDKNLYDDFGFYRELKVPPITHEELKRLRHNGWSDTGLFFAEMITGDEDMNVLGFLGGKPGAGKSSTGLELLWGSSIWTADLLWKDPAKWQKVFPFTRTIKVIDGDGQFKEIFKDTSKYTHKFVDDAFKVLNRLKFQSELSQDLASIAATDRPFRNETLISAQWMGMIDKIIRELAGFRIDCKRDKKARKLGYNKYKFHILDYNPYDKSNPIMNRYIHTNKVDVEDHVAGLPCEMIWDWYKVERYNAALKLKQDPEDQEGNEPAKAKLSSSKGMVPKIISHMELDIPPQGKSELKVYYNNLANMFNCSEETVKRAYKRWELKK